MTTSLPEPGSEVAYRPETETYQAMFAHGSNPPSTVVVDAVATICNCEVEDLEPLYETLDPAALDALFQPTSSGTPRAEGEVTFRYQGYEIRVRSCGEILLRPVDELD